MACVVYVYQSMTQDQSMLDHDGVRKWVRNLVKQGLDLRYLRQGYLEEDYILDLGRVTTYHEKWFGYDMWRLDCEYRYLKFSLS